MLQNREQIRARNALHCADNAKIVGDNDGEVVKKVPPLIMNHGLLATAAFAKQKGGGWATLFDYLAAHLADVEINAAPKEANTLEGMLRWLTSTGCSSEALKYATAEAMAWLQFARRFIQH